MKASLHSLDDMRLLKAAVKQRREAEQARAAAAEQARLQREREHNLFAHSIGQVQPLPSQHLSRIQHSPTPIPPRPLQLELDEKAVLREALSDMIDVTTLLETDESLSYRQPGIGLDVVRKLRLGHWKIQAELDLHGYRRDGARETFGAFIRECQHRGIRCVRIVTGKGLGSPGKTSIIKHKMYGWLVQKKEVLAFVQAKPSEGGAGALVVLLAPEHRMR